MPCRVEERLRRQLSDFLGGIFRKGNLPYGYASGLLNARGGPFCPSLVTFGNVTTNRAREDFVLR